MIEGGHDRDVGGHGVQVIPIKAPTFFSYYIDQAVGTVEALDREKAPKVIPAELLVDG